MKKLLVLLLAVVLCTASVGLAEEAELEQFPCFGVLSQTAVLAVFLNDTDQSIDQLWISSSQDDADVSVDLLQGHSIAAGERFGVWIERGADGKAVCDIQLGFADGKQMTLHEIDAEDFAQAVICRDVNVAYVSFTSLSTGEAVNTWLHELKLLELEEAMDGPLPDDSERETMQSDDFES